MDMFVSTIFFDLPFELFTYAITDENHFLVHENSGLSMHNRFDKTQTLTPVDTSAKLHHTLFLIIFYSCIFGPATHSYVPLLYALFSIFSCVFGPATHAVF